MTPETLRHYAMLGGVFLTVLTLVLLLGSSAGAERRSRPRAVAARLREITDSVRRPESIVLDRDTGPQLPDAVRRVLGATLTQKLALLLVRSGSQASPLLVLVGIAGLFVAAALMAWLLDMPALAVPAGLVAGLVPIAVLQGRAVERSRRFSTQYAEALDFLARSMRTGHDLTASMRMVSEEFPDPLGGEFRKAVEESGFGMPLEESFSAMAERVSCYDIGYLIACVAIQRETGGSLANAIATLAKTIRDRFVFDGKVKVLSAQGRLSAIILCLLPLLVLGFMFLSNRKYVSVFWTTDAGKQMFVMAGGLLIAGSIWVMRTVRVKV